MRAATPTELATLAATAFWVYVKVEIQDLDLVWQDMTALQEINWCEGYDLDFDIDQPVAQATFQFRRDADFIGSPWDLITDASERIIDDASEPILLFARPAALSLSPLREDSLVNRDSAGNFAALVDVGRPIRCSIAALPVGGTPGLSDWHRLFEGVIDVVSFEHEPAVVQARDNGGAVVDAWELTATTYGNNTPIETVIQDILNGMPAGTAPTLYTPTSPLFEITNFKTSVQSKMDAITNLIGAIGWDCRYKWDDGTQAFRFTFSDPNRSKTTPDATIAGNQYLDVTALRIDRTAVRNHVEVEYGPIADVRNRAIAEDATSQARYGYRPVVFIEGDDSAIDTATEANAMRDAALSDLKDPKAQQQVEMFCYWPVELHDLIRFTANGRHYSSDQDLAVTKVRHYGQVASDGSASHRTTLDVRGKPAGAYSAWLKRAYRPPIITDPSVPTLEVTVSYISATQAQVTWTSSGAVDYRIDGGAWTTPAAGVPPLVVDRYPSTGADRTVDVRATLGKQSIIRSVTVKKQDATTPTISTPVVTKIDGTSFSVDWSVTNMPGGTTYKLTWSVDGDGSGTVNPATSVQTVTGAVLGSAPSGTVTIDAISGGVTIATKSYSGPFLV